MVSWLSLHLYKYIPVSIECFGLVVVIMLISIQFNSMVVFAHIYTSFIDSRGTDPSVVYLRSHHVIQDFFLLLPENLSTLRYLIKIFGWFDSSFLSCLFLSGRPFVILSLGHFVTFSSLSLNENHCFSLFFFYKSF